MLVTLAQLCFSWGWGCASPCRAAGSEEGEQRAAQLWDFLVQALKIARKEVLIIPPCCLLQNFRGGDSLGFRNASLRRRG